MRAGAFAYSFVAIGLHLWHGIWSLTQTFGWAHPRYNKLRRAFATAERLPGVTLNTDWPDEAMAEIGRAHV